MTTARRQLIENIVKYRTVKYRTVKYSEIQDSHIFFEIQDSHILALLIKSFA
ncbi:Uncharacterised protein [Shewanella algae]|uniref:Uncharacterized protein n=1 Tax=Shewanella algae TaxID=38313 RepID=A0A380C3A9_9GAMM|nr:Uncharacterised protein [Shewanella algae]